MGLMTHMDTHELGEMPIAQSPDGTFSGRVLAPIPSAQPEYVSSFVFNFLMWLDQPSDVRQLLARRATDHYLHMLLEDPLVKEQGPDKFVEIDLVAAMDTDIRERVRPLARKVGAIANQFAEQSDFDLPQFWQQGTYVYSLESSGQLDAETPVPTRKIFLGHLAPRSK